MASRPYFHEKQCNISSKKKRHHPIMMASPIGDVILLLFSVIFDVADFRSDLSPVATSWIVFFLRKWVSLWLSQHVNNIHNEIPHPNENKFYSLRSTVSIILINSKNGILATTIATILFLPQRLPLSSGQSEPSRKHYKSHRCPRGSFNVLTRDRSRLQPDDLWYANQSLCWPEDLQHPDQPILLWQWQLPPPEGMVDVYRTSRRHLLLLLTHIKCEACNLYMWSGGCPSSNPVECTLRRDALHCWTGTLVTDKRSSIWIVFLVASLPSSEQTDKLELSNVWKNLI